METTALGKRGIESLRNGEDIIEAILKGEKMKEEYMDFEEELIGWEKSDQFAKKPVKPDMIQLMGSKSIPEYVFAVISRTRLSNLNGSLRFLHLVHVEPLLLYVRYCLSNNVFFDLSLHVLNFVVRNFEFQIFSSAKLLGILKKIHLLVTWRLKARMDTIGYNLAGLKFVLKEMSFTHVEEFEMPAFQVEEKKKIE